MSIWILEPRDPLIARDGRPFGAEAGANARSLPLPYPGTLAGAWRTRAGRGADGAFDPSKADTVKQLALVGPLLVELAPDGRPHRFAAPAPADAVLFADGQRVSCHGLRPFTPGAGEMVALPEGLRPLAFAGAAPPGKPWSEAPAYWTWTAFERWLLNPEDAPWAAAGAASLPAPERRTHVALVPGGSTAREGALFTTEGRRYLGPAPGFGRLGLAVAVPDDDLPSGVESVGGERRLAEWRPAGVAWPEPPVGLVEAIVERRACRLVLLTPGLYAAGWRPGALEAEGVGVRLVAAAVGRPEVVSGWDLAARRPKPTRRLARVGSVYFLDLEGDAAAIARWVRARWFTCTSDEAQDRRDGYGLAVVGVWPPEEA